MFDTRRLIIRNPTSSISESVLKTRIPNKQKSINIAIPGKSILKSRKRTVRVGFLVANVAVFAIVGSLLVFDQKSDNQSNYNAAGFLAAKVSEEAANPIDKLSSADIAVHVARVAQLEEADSVVNNADTLSTDLEVVATDQLVTKPQIVTGSLKSKSDIQTYIVQKGDTMSSVAKKFGITTDTIRLSNGIGGNDLSPGQKITISPVNGLVYTVQNGDTPKSIAAKFRANKAQLIAFNDAELTGSFKPGEKIVVPDGSKPEEPRRYSYASGLSRTSSFSFGAAPIYGSNSYAYGFCTWGVANLISIPSNWGNASSWAARARISGWNVSTTPSVGSIAQRGGGLGHVGIVTAVSPDGSMIKYKDMNGLAGFGRYGETADWVPTHSAYQYFISH